MIFSSYCSSSGINRMKCIRSIHFLEQIKAYGVNCSFSYIRNLRLFFSASEVPEPVRSGFPAAVERLFRKRVGTAKLAVVTLSVYEDNVVSFRFLVNESFCGKSIHRYLSSASVAFLLRAITDSHFLPGTSLPSVKHLPL